MILRSLTLWIFLPLLILTAISTTNSKSFAAAPTSLSERVEIPRADWNLCRQYKETLEARTVDLNACARQGIDVRQKRDQCVGALNAKTADLNTCSAQLGDYRLKVQTLEGERSAMFWASSGALLVSVAALALEIFGPSSPELLKLATLGAATAISGGLFVWSF